uniref:Putative Methyltransferase n=1 Tax=Magnetococcus massalia (strain MO-1) TaxID=451514 RepID=A0A1S7LHT8_MAGMO|nr:putative Methyltransferase [Candidatus Magnetococcus massalia]
MLRKLAKKVLALHGWQDPAYKDTALYQLYLRLFFPKRWEEQCAEFNMEFAFYQKMTRSIGNPQLVFDVGANNGFKANLFRRLVSKVVCLEPDEVCFDILERRFAAYPQVQRVQIAVGAKAGEEKLFVHDKGSALNTLNHKWKEVLESEALCRFDKTITFKGSCYVRVTTLDLLIEKFGRPDYIKIDVEGYEFEVLRGLSQPVPLISFEANLPEFLGETLTSIDHLYQLSPKTTFRFFESLDEPDPSQGWLSYELFRNKVANTSSRYFEVFARNFVDQ